MAQNEKQLALLKNKLQMPLIVRDLLITNQTPDADAQYALHEMMGNFKTEDAILSAAFIMQEIANHEAIINTDLAFLKMECERLIERYSARDDLAHENPNLWTETQGEMLDVMYEDMEDFMELIALCQLSYDITNSKIAKLLDIITIQFQSHLMILDEVIEMQQNNNHQTQISAPSCTGFDADNVIMFPG